MAQKAAIDCRRTSLAGQAQHEREGRARTGPLLLDDFAARTSEDAAKHERDQHGIVELACDGDEVWDEIERQQQVRDESGEQQLVATAHPVVGEQPSEEHDAVGDEARDRACIVAAPQEDERDNEAGVCEHHAGGDSKRYLGGHGLESNRGVSARS